MLLYSGDVFFHFLFFRRWRYRAVWAVGQCHHLFVCAFTALYHFWDNPLSSLRALTAPKCQNCSFFCPPCRLPTRSSGRWTWSPRRFFLLREPSGLTWSRVLRWWPVARPRWSKPTTTTPSWSANCERRWAREGRRLLLLLPLPKTGHPKQNLPLAAGTGPDGTLLWYSPEILLSFVLHCVSFVAEGLLIESSKAF